jgi:hypothetical protein
MILKCFARITRKEETMRIRLVHEDAISPDTLYQKKEREWFIGRLVKIAFESLDGKVEWMWVKVLEVEGCRVYFRHRPTWTDKKRQLQTQQRLRSSLWVRPYFLPFRHRETRAAHFRHVETWARFLCSSGGYRFTKLSSELFPVLRSLCRR